MRIKLSILSPYSLLPTPSFPERSIKIDANNPKSYLNRGVVYYLIGNQSKAMENFQQAAFLFGLDGDSDRQKIAVDMLNKFQNRHSPQRGNRE